MKSVILFAFAALLSTQAFAASAKYVSCRKSESDLQCANRVILKSEALSGSYYTGSQIEWPMLVPAIFAKKPMAVHTMSRSGDGDSIMTQYMFVYEVSATDISGIKAAAFTVTVEQQVEDTGAAAPKVVGRAIDLSTLKIISGDLSDDN